MIPGTPSLAGRAGWLPKVHIPGEKKIMVSLFLGLLYLSLLFSNIHLLLKLKTLCSSQLHLLFYNWAISSFSLLIYCLKHSIETAGFRVGGWLCSEA